MINEDKTFDPLKVDYAPFQSQNSDDDEEESPLSHYSSFGESEFDRYCSANSAMGTPSVCGSVGPFQERESQELDFSSLEGSGLGDFNNRIENFKLEGEFSKSFQERRLTSSGESGSFFGHKGQDCEGKNSFDEKNVKMERNRFNNTNQNAIWLTDGFSSHNEIDSVNRNATTAYDELCEFDDSGGIVRNVQQKLDISSINIPIADINVQVVENSLSESQLQSDAALEREGGENYSDEDKTSSRPEHSDGEDSMFGSGTDYDQKMENLNRNNLQLYQAAKRENGNNFLMSSSIAFGSDDWDDYSQETKQFDITSMMLDKNEIDIPVSRTIGQGAVEVLDRSENTFSTPTNIVNVIEVKHRKDVEDMLIAKEDMGVRDDLPCNLADQVDSDISSIEYNPLLKRSPPKKEVHVTEGNLGERTQFISIRDCNNVEATTSQSHSVSAKTFEVPGKNFIARKKNLVMMDRNSTESLQDFPASLELFQSHRTPVKTDNINLNDFCDELVHEMEEILLDATESKHARFTHSNITSQANSPLPLRDGGSTASTSDIDHTHPPNQQTHKIDLIEVIGAKQRKGDVSFSERLVGVKEYTVYVIKVTSGNDHWEVERRYRDFCTLYRRLKTVFAAQGWVLPSSWLSVERESRKIFGNVSPDVVRERSALIQDCLRSILSCQFSSSLPSSLIWFLSPQKDLPSSPSSNTHDPSAYMDSKMVFGKTISLVVEVRPYKSTKQILEMQHFTCAGCHKHFDDGKTRVLEYVQALGWGKPRLCEYSGQLFCSICHTNELAVLPARVLQYWDFTLYPVSQMAKSYLDSILDKPMLCVSAVNPFLFSKVPALQQVTSVRKRIGDMLPFVRCPFRMSIFKGLGSRRYILESSDFFALKDLIDLSRGAFAGLPVMVDAVSRKILEHITEHCLICCDAGVPCNARQACNDPSALVFPFQEGEIIRCRSCKSVFHKHCFKKVPKCPCGESLRIEGEKDYKAKSVINSSTFDLFGRKSDSSTTMGFISSLFTKAKPEKLPTKDGDTVISMGSLTSPSL